MPYPYNPYGIQPNYGYQPSYPQPAQNSYVFVNGIEGAKSYVMSPNQTMMLMDSDAPIAYLKQSNAMGQSTIRCFRLVETTEDEIKGASKPSQFVTREEFQAFKDSLAKKEGE